MLKGDLCVKSGWEWKIFKCLFTLIGEQLCRGVQACFDSVIRDPSRILAILVRSAQQKLPHICITLRKLLLVTLALLNNEEGDHIDQLQGRDRDASADDEVLLRTPVLTSCSAGLPPAHHVLAQCSEWETFIAIIEVDALVPARPRPQIRGMWL